MQFKFSGYLYFLGLVTNGEAKEAGNLNYITFNLQVNNHNVYWSEFVSHWPLWSVYIAHFCMNWSTYIIMQWLPTYMARNLGADKNDIMFTAVPYVLNSLVGVGECFSSNEVPLKAVVVIVPSCVYTHLFMACCFETLWA